MTVYVDDMYRVSMGSYGRMKMSHMIADTTEELLSTADRIGVDRKWIQGPGTATEHFDIAMSKRRLAVSVGAVEVTMRYLASICAGRSGGKGMRPLSPPATPARQSLPLGEF